MLFRSAFVELLPECRPSPDEDFHIVYNHPNTFESEDFAKTGRKSEKPVCLFSAGYSAGWCAYSYGMDLDAREIECIACGDADCRFVMAPPHRLEERIRQYRAGELSA